MQLLFFPKSYLYYTQTNKQTNKTLNTLPCVISQFEQGHLVNLRVEQIKLARTSVIKLELLHQRLCFPAISIHSSFSDCGSFCSCCTWLKRTNVHHCKTARNIFIVEVLA